MSDLAILACYAHPDDEQGVTGTLMKYHGQGYRTGILCATRGEVGEISDLSLATPETLGQVREQELRRAAQHAEVDKLYFMDYRDSGMVGTPENMDPRAFINANEDDAVGRIVRVIREFKPTVMVTFDETGGYGHPDHLAIHRWTTKAFQMAGDPACYPDLGPAFAPARLYYSSVPRSGLRRMQEYMKANNIDTMFARVDSTKMGLDDSLITNRVRVEPFIERKRKSLEEHRTQFNPTSAFALIPESLWKEWRSTEYFAYAAGHPIPSGADPDDLFAGLR